MKKLFRKNKVNSILLIIIICLTFTNHGYAQKTYDDLSDEELSDLIIEKNNATALEAISFRMLNSGDVDKIKYGLKYISGLAEEQDSIDLIFFLHQYYLGVSFPSVKNKPRKEVPIPDVEKALYWGEKSAKKGEMNPAILIALIYQYNEEFRNEEKAKFYFEHAYYIVNKEMKPKNPSIEEGFFSMRNQIKIASYLTGLGTEQDINKAIELGYQNEDLTDYYIEELRKNKVIQEEVWCQILYELNNMDDVLNFFSKIENSFMLNYKK